MSTCFGSCHYITYLVRTNLYLERAAPEGLFDGSRLCFGKYRECRATRGAAARTLTERVEVGALWGPTWKRRAEKRFEWGLGRWVGGGRRRRLGSPIVSAGQRDEEMWAYRLRSGAMTSLPKRRMMWSGSGPMAVIRRTSTPQSKMERALARHSSGAPAIAKRSAK